ncbi:nitroreductase family protein [Pontibacter sp. JAM-7]|uniref:nitroreductase family protein n=1 Tax=Pontibacter sp. JAM-7 TaxID=3366581 RepID=UPI003AF8E895
MGLKKELLKLFGRGNKRKSSKGQEVFAGEIKAVRSGVAAYKVDHQPAQQHSPLLRRNTHRLEKGLCFPNAKKTFAEKYIGETVQAYQAAVSSGCHDEAELEWSNAVLSRYFDTVEKSDDKVALAYQAFRQIVVAHISGSDKTPFSFREITHDSGFDADRFLQLCENRVSCRWFEDRKVMRHQVEHAVSCATQAASACNRQPYRYLLIENPCIKQQIVNLPFGTAGFGNELPHLIMVLGDLSNFALARDRHLIYIDSALATSQLMLGFTAQGLASVPINWPDVEANHQSARDLLDLESFHVPIMLVGFGYPDPDALIPFSQKKSPQSLLKVYE